MLFGAGPSLTASGWIHDPVRGRLINVKDRTSHAFPLHAGACPRDILAFSIPTKGAGSDTAIACLFDLAGHSRLAVATWSRGDHRYRDAAGVLDLELPVEARPDEHIEAEAHTDDGRTYVRSYWVPACDVHEQIKHIVFHTKIYGVDGRIEEDRIDTLELAWIYGREWKLLLELEGFELERLDGGFHGEAPGVGWEYVWVARRVGG